MISVHQHLRERVGRTSEGSAKTSQEAKAGISDRRGYRGGSGSSTGRRADDVVPD